MAEIDETRKQIEEIDREMAKLFEKRMACVEGIAGYKKERGLPVYDADREKALLTRNLDYVENESVKDYYAVFQKSVMDVSKAYQGRLMDGAKVAYAGTEGAFAETAARKACPQGVPVPYDGFADAYASVVEGKSDVAVLPLENSYAGEVGQVMDLIFQGTLYVNRVISVPIVQNLLAVPGATLTDIKKVISHPQAIAQSGEYIRKHKFEVQEHSNTALAAKLVAEMNDKSVAAIAGEDAGELYGLQVLSHGINGSELNTTRFGVFSRAENRTPVRSDGNFILVFSVMNEAGSLAKAINILGSFGFNMRALHSRPMKDLVWNYYFFIECEGNVRSDSGDMMLKALGGICDRLKLVGSYRSE